GATNSVDADGSNVNLPAYTPPNSTTVTFTPSAGFNAISLSITYSGGQRAGYVYHAYIEPYTLPLTLKNTSFTSCGPIGINDLLNYATPDLLDYEIIDNATGLAVESGHYINVSGNYKIRMTDPGTNDSTKYSPSFA